ncbi:terminase gpA endonuclease subunit [Pseudovibrio sp. POLY-S9]|uniref:terminase gpA endonuclease subunit n=1 Tax=Pseudovibrio sp. POLY-S9 TaxID=1576596 RepID=UPI00070D2F9D|nr:terminase gpA endonuclease subunit [Pseudovibrio sp. POLY-S9]
MQETLGSLRGANTRVYGAARLVTRVLAKAIRPKKPLPFHEWLPKNIELVDGPRRGELWNAKDAPYLPEIAACLSADHPCNYVCVRKSQQTGVSILGLSWSIYLAENAPDNILYAVPGDQALKETNSMKIMPLIEAWEKRTSKQVIEPITSRSGKGSTTFEKKFPGGALSLANANSEMDLSSKTIKYGVKDEVSKWEETDNGGDPEELFFGRFTAFRREKSYKIFALSTPEHDSGDEDGEGPGHCRIDRDFKRSDQRFWHIRCPSCDFEQRQDWSGFQINREDPEESTYLCEECGHSIKEAERVVAVRKGQFIALKAGEGRQPGFHVDAFCSLMMSYGDIARDFINAEKRSEAAKKNFTNLVLAKAYAMRGNAPKHERLMERREQLERGKIPAEGLLFVAGADVQHYGIYVEAVAFGDDRQSWCVDAHFLEGSTDDIKAGAWLKLDAFYKQHFKDAWGMERRLDGLAVDAGDSGRMEQVLSWCRARPDTYAIKGQGGRGVPAIGLPQKKSVNKRGKRVKVRGSQLWPVGTWGLKHEFFGSLHKSGMAAGAECDPPGYCHYGVWLDEEYFLQITAEYFDQKLVKGRLLEEWKKSRKDNHFLDCRIYAMAIAEHLGLTSNTDNDWARLRKRLVPAKDLDLLSPEAVKVNQASTPTKTSQIKAAPAHDNGWAERQQRIRKRREKWRNR